MSCSAKIPIYAFFTEAFFENYKPLVMISLYFGGMLIGIIASLLMKATVFRGKPVPFVMELPNYRLPSAKSVLQLMWDKAKDFLQRAFTVIFVATMIIWFLQHFDTRLNFVASGGDGCLLALLGKIIAPVFSPLGFGNWQSVTALIAGFTAKEAVVSTLQVLGGSELFTTVTAIPFLVFTLLYTPCIAAVTAIKRELSSVLGAVMSVIFQCSVAYAVAFAVYRIALLFV